MDCDCHTSLRGGSTLVRSIKGYSRLRSISLLCITALIGPMVASALIPTPASAQTQIVKIAVTNFRNLSKVSDQMVGTMATDSLVMELTRSGKYDPARADAVTAKTEELGYKSAILNPAMLQRLGQEIGTDWIATGDVIAVQVSKEKKRAEARVAVRVLDTTTGEWVNGAVATGSSHYRIGDTGERDTDWIAEAIDDATRKAVEAINSTSTPEATIIGNSAVGEVLLNKGTSSGLEPGMEMIAIRRVGVADASQEVVVGRIKVTRVSDSDSYATVTKSIQGVRPEDRVRAVYQLPSNQEMSSDQRTKSQVKQSMTSASKVLWGLVALAGLVSLFSKGNGDSGDSIPLRGTPAATGDSLVLNWAPSSQGKIVQYHIWRQGPDGKIIVGSVDANAPTIDTEYMSLKSDGTANTSSVAYQTVDTAGALADGTGTISSVLPNVTYTYYVSAVYNWKLDSDGAQLYQEGLYSNSVTWTPTIPVVAAQ